MECMFLHKKDTLKLLIDILSTNVMHAILTVIKIKYKYITLRSRVSHFVIIFIEHKKINVRKKYDSFLNCEI